MKLERQLVDVECEKEKNSDQLSVMRQIVDSGCQDDAFFVCDQARLIKNYKYWTEKLQNVTPYYDAGCNISSMVINTLAELGAKFSCQNKFELERLSKLGISPQSVVFNGSAKVASHLRMAKSCGVDIISFETLNDLMKLKTFNSSARLIYQMNFPCNSFSVNAISDLFKEAAIQDMKIVGISLKVAEADLATYRKAVGLARLMFSIAKGFGHDLYILDLGEVLPDPGRLEDFEELVDELHSWITSQFQSLENFDALQMFAHPSEFLVNSAFSLVTKVIGKRTSRVDDVISYVINDGIFGAFGRLLQDDDLVLTPRPLHGFEDDKKAMTSDVYGPSGHDMDQICSGLPISDLEIGDWIVFDNMGAFAMSVWDEESNEPGPESLSRIGVSLMADNYWFFSKYESHCFKTDSYDSDECNHPTAENDFSVFELPGFDFDENDEQKFCTLIR